MAQYGKAEYWEDRYQKDKEPFDWYQRWSGFKEHIQKVLTEQPITYQILNVGAGNSRFSEEMFDDGFQNIVNIDISFTVVKAMQELYKEKYPSLIYKQGDVRQLQFEDGFFDVVIDKGTLDSILCGDGSGPNADQMINEIYRVLKDDGSYICISYGVKESRLPYLKKFNAEKEPIWHLDEPVGIAKPTFTTQAPAPSEAKADKNFHWMYVMRKKQPEPKTAGAGAAQ